MSIQTQTPAPTPQEKTLQRTGGCVVCRCERFELAGKKDGFRTCECHHTQLGHRRPDPVG